MAPMNSDGENTPPPKPQPSEIAVAATLSTISAIKSGSK